MPLKLGAAEDLTIRVQEPKHKVLPKTMITTPALRTLFLGTLVPYSNGMRGTKQVYVQKASWPTHVSRKSHKAKSGLHLPTLKPSDHKLQTLELVRPRSLNLGS